MKNGLLPDLCSHWKASFASGDVLGASYHYELGDDLISFAVEPSDCP